MPSLYPESVGVVEIQRLTSLLADAAEHAGIDIPVPTCEGWSMGDLVWHVTEVQDFWTYIIATRPGGPKYYDQPPRASDQRLVANLRNASAGLCAALEAAPVTDQAWSWAPEQTVGFSLRRQTHEVLTHCVDAVIAAGLPLPAISSELAADGVDEIVHVMVGDPDPEATGTITLHATDTGDRWTIAFGDGDVVIDGKAIDLNLWLWGRARTWPLSFSAVSDQAEALRAHIAGRTQ